MDIKAKIEEIVEKVKNDENFKAEFKKDPVEAVGKVLGIDIPEEEINKIVDAIKAKVSVDDIKGAIGNFFGGNK